MNLLKWLTLGLAGSGLSGLANTAPTLNTGHYNPCYQTNFNAGKRSAQYGTTILIYPDSETASECHPGLRGDLYYICDKPTNRPCGSMMIEGLDTSTRSESNINNPCLKITAEAGKTGFFQDRETLAKCPPSSNYNEAFPTRVEGKVIKCPIEKGKPCVKPIPQKPDKMRWNGNIG